MQSTCGLHPPMRAICDRLTEPLDRSPAISNTPDNSHSGSLKEPTLATVRGESKRGN
jgi:hypothetical protein